MEKLSKFLLDLNSSLKFVVNDKRAYALLKPLKTLFKKLDPHGKVHPEFKQYGPLTARIYSYIQNLPQQVRKVLIPNEEENLFTELNWSQQELRAIAGLSQEPILLDCSARKKDLHRKVISEMFHKPLSELIDEERRVEKTINYGLIYGQEALGLTWNLNRTLEEARKPITRYFSSLPLIRKLNKGVREKFLKEHYPATSLASFSFLIYRRTT